MEPFDEDHSREMLEQMAETNRANEIHARHAWSKFAFLTGDDTEARCRRGACLTRDLVYSEDGVPAKCRHCGTQGDPCAHPNSTHCTGCRAV